MERSLDQPRRFTLVNVLKVGRQNIIAEQMKKNEKSLSDRKSKI